MPEARGARLEGPSPSSLRRWHRRLVFVYIVECSDGSYYVGHTTDLAHRERVHNEGRGSRFTAGRRPVAMVYAEQWSTLAAAVRREKQLKRWSSLKKEALIKRDSGSLKAASRHRT